MTKSKELKKVLILMSLHAAIVLSLLCFLNIWVDEASTLYTTRNGFFAALQNTLRDEKQAPLYFLIMSVWREINSSIFFAQLFSVICSLLAIKFFCDLARKLWDENTSTLIGFLFAIHPYLFWASLEIRVYSLMILLSILLLKFFREGFWENSSADESPNSPKKARIYYLITAVFSLYTNYFLGFLLVGGFVALIALKRWRAAKIYFLQMIIAGLFFLPMLFVIKSQMSVITDGYAPPTHLIDGLKILWNHFLTFVLPTEIFTSGDATTISIFRVWFVRIAILAIITLLLIKKKFLDEKLLVFASFAGTVFTLSLLFYLKFGASYMEIRHAAAIFVPTFLLMFSALWAIKPRGENRSKVYFVSIAILLAVFYVYSLISLHPNLMRRGDWARAADYIEQNEREGQPIIIFPNYDALALPNYYEGKNKVFPNEKFFAWNLEAAPENQNAFREQIDYVLSTIPPDADEIWLLTAEDCRTSDACLPLENYINANYTVIDAKDFYLERLRLLRRKQNDRRN